MLLRVLAVLALAAVGSGCAGGVLGPSLVEETGSLGVAPSSDETGAGDFGEKSLAAKVLAALALERSTGRTPDPARLDDLN